MATRRHAKARCKKPQYQISVLLKIARGWKDLGGFNDTDLAFDFASAVANARKRSKVVLRFNESGQIAPIQKF